jgi:hypothetical protein
MARRRLVEPARRKALDLGHLGSWCKPSSGISKSGSREQKQKWQSHSRQKVNKASTLSRKVQVWQRLGMEALSEAGAGAGGLLARSLGRPGNKQHFLWAGTQTRHSAKTPAATHCHPLQTRAHFDCDLRRCDRDAGINSSKRGNLHQQLELRRSSNHHLHSTHNNHDNAGATSNCRAA